MISSLSTPETASSLSLTNDLEELDWYFQDMFDQFGNVYCFLDDINQLLIDYPLEFLLFEIQQLVSFLRRHWTSCPPFVLLTIARSTLSPSTIPPKLLPPLFTLIAKFLMFDIFYVVNPLLKLAFDITLPHVQPFSLWKRSCKIFKTVETMFSLNLLLRTLFTIFDRSWFKHIVAHKFPRLPL